MLNSALGVVDGSLHLTVSSINMLNQTKPSKHFQFCCFGLSLGTLIIFSIWYKLNFRNLEISWKAALNSTPLLKSCQLSSIGKALVCESGNPGGIPR
jgi:hypothetical protein